MGQNEVIIRSERHVHISRDTDIYCYLEAGAVTSTLPAYCERVCLCERVCTYVFVCGEQRAQWTAVGFPVNCNNEQL